MIHIQFEFFHLFSIPWEQIIRLFILFIKILFKLCSFFFKSIVFFFQFNHSYFHLVEGIFDIGGTFKILTRQNIKNLLQILANHTCHFRRSLFSVISKYILSALIKESKTLPYYLNDNFILMLDGFLKLVSLFFDFIIIFFELVLVLATFISDFIHLAERDID